MSLVPGISTVLVTLLALQRELILILIDSKQQNVIKIEGLIVYAIFVLDNTPLHTVLTKIEA